MKITFEDILIGVAFVIVLPFALFFWLLTYPAIMYDISDGDIQ